MEDRRGKRIEISSEELEVVREVARSRGIGTGQVQLALHMIIKGWKDLQPPFGNPGEFRAEYYSIEVWNPEEWKNLWEPKVWTQRGAS